MISVGKTSVTVFELIVLGFALCCLTLCAAGLLHLPEIYTLAQQQFLWEEENQLDATQCFIELQSNSIPQPGRIACFLYLAFRPPATRNYTPHTIVAV